MPNRTLEDKLRLLDFETDAPASGLLFTNKKKDYRNSPDVFFDEVLILNRAEDIGARAVYFRRFEGKSSVPQIFIFDNSDGSISLEDQIDIHRKIWSSGIVALYYVFDKTEVRIFNCRKSLRKSRRKPLPDPLKSLELTSKVHSIYSEHMFKNGSFWELPENKNHFKDDSSSNQKLIDGLKKIRKEFSKGPKETVCNKLLVLSILVKYLEERKCNNGNHVLQRYFSKFEGAVSFCDVLRKNRCVEFFKDLGKDINGKIFELEKQEEAEIAKLDQSQLADFLDAKLDNYQYVFWRLYDFNYLPVELISRIYEEFIPTRKDIVYTPTHLVDFMVDECMPIEKPKSNVKIIDVSCGSGIFMVAAFKRIVEWRQKEKYAKTGKIISPNIQELKSILKNQIYGVDIESEAVKLTIFSLAIAVCDILEPTKMWEELTKEKLGDLSENVKEGDFFDSIKSGDKFDLIMGNPPFNPPVRGEEAEKEYWEDLIKKVELDFEIPDKNIALLFLQQAMKKLKTGGLLSFVMPSGPLLYNKTIGYRKKFLDKYNVPQIFDFSSLSGKILSSNYPVSVIFAENKAPDDKDILHAVVKRTRTSKERLYFEIDKYDLHYVPKETAKTEQLIWKANYLGGGHLFYLLKRTQGLRTIGDYLKNKKKNNGWFFGEGYQCEVKSTEQPKKASWLTNKRMIPTEKFIDDYIHENDIDYETAQLFHRPRKRNKLIFKGPHILIKEKPELPVAFRGDDLIFKNEIMGIHAPEEQKQELIELRKRIIDNRLLYKMFLLSASGRAGISRSVKTILKSDIMALPYPEEKKKLILSRAEQMVCDDIVDYGIEQMTSGEDSEVCAKEADRRTLKDFGKIFCTSLNSIYKEGPKQFYPLEHIESDSFICFPFAYGNPGKPKIISKTKGEKIEQGNLESLLDHQQGKNVLYKRIIKLYGKDMVYLIKPKTLRYWLRSIALRDANEVFTDLVSSGY